MSENTVSVARGLVSLALVVLFLAGAVGMVQHFKATKPAPRQKPVVEDVARVVAPPLQVARNYQVRLRSDGQAKPAVLVKVIPQVGGKVIEIGENFEDQAKVKAGDLLMQIDQTDAKQDLQAAKAQQQLYQAQLDRLAIEKENVQAQIEIEKRRVEIAENQLKRLRELQGQGAATENDIDTKAEQLLMRQAALRNYTNQLALIPQQEKEITARLDTVAADWERAKTRLERTTILSPIDGRVIYSSVKGKIVVSANNPNPYGELFSPKVMEVAVSIPAEDMKWIPEEWVAACQANGNIPEDKRIHASVIWKPDGETIDKPITWKGCVTRIGAGLDDRTRLRPLIVRIDNSAKVNANRPALERNKFVDVVIFGQKLKEVFVLPRSAIMAPDEQYDSESVWLAVEGKLRRRPIDVLRYEDENALILPQTIESPEFGLAVGDRVVTNEIPLPIIGMNVEIFATQAEMQQAVAGADKDEPASPQGDTPDGSSDQEG